MRETGKATLARAVMSAVEPLVELLLELGITSPEAESLLRSVFVHKARDWLAKSSGGAGSPSDVRVALMTGVHRNFVRGLLDEPPRIAAARERKGHRTARLLEAWHSDPTYLDSSGKPRDLSERETEPSFFTLASTYVPGAAPGVVLKELRRAGVVQSLSEHRVRVLSDSFRVQGVNARNIYDLGKRAKDLLEALALNLRAPEKRLYFGSMSEVDVDVERIPAVRDLIARRAGTFLAAMERELGLETNRSRGRKSVQRVRVGLTAFETERWPTKSRREER